ncbi:hypothetical protein FKV24_016360 [Lysobacter maris]|uniref:Uncharacterized protein n=1 Tax=Marilutibacter maris TaxID=1605891 RepID=A0A508A608_9GAMM|nr:hypothetical protein [Lysobacter maris]KAB8168483.1 hypothetical protein FKV24_016360 [Lysobacter maris]
MPLTAFSKATGEELDVEQVLSRLARASSVDSTDLGPEGIPDAWRQIIREDMECPSCFTLGADLVREGVSTRGSKRIVRQACFRYPSHRPQCDFARPSVTGTTVPDNLVEFGSAKTGLTRAVRQLVGAGIQTNSFSQRTIRDMREWFFAQKASSTFTVTLDPRLPTWLEDVLRQAGGFYGPPPITLTPEIARLPGFDWREAARQHFRARNHSYIETLVAAELRIWATADRMANLARRFQGEVVFDPSPLRARYLSTVQLAAFISQNYEPLRRFTRSGGRDPHAPAVLAFAALVLYVEGWDINEAAALFGRIAQQATDADPDLGNVMGLNPWHDFEAWRQLKALQDLRLAIPDGAASPQEEISAIETALRCQYADTN